ncbi:MAG: PocR ligand-binding domain-containing protein [Caldilineales bacterium]|nr:PocR ligand-binding domain-containing protein [Caldilineales bacterium]
MNELLTAREVQELLKVDRTTVYRMLKDGRLQGVKIGHHWRFPISEVDDLLARDEEPDLPRTHALDVLPMHCVAPIQKVFAEVAEVGAITTAIDGEPLSNVSNSCQFCDLILASPKGRAGCIASWQRLAHQSNRSPEFHACHAGLHYARARIEINGEFAAMLFAGQFYAEPPDKEEEAQRVARLAKAYDIDAEILQQAIESMRVLPAARREQITGWLQQVAGTFEDIGRERAELMSRLQSIARMSAI